MADEMKMADGNFLSKWLSKVSNAVFKSGDEKTEVAREISQQKKEDLTLDEVTSAVRHAWDDAGDAAKATKRAIVEAVRDYNAAHGDKHPVSSNVEAPSSNEKKVDGLKLIIN